MLQVDVANDHPSMARHPGPSAGTYDLETRGRVRQYKHDAQRCATLRWRLIRGRLRETSTLCRCGDVSNLKGLGFLSSLEMYWYCKASHLLSISSLIILDVRSIIATKEEVNDVLRLQDHRSVPCLRGFCHRDVEPCDVEHKGTIPF
jgi:hypothetical protein